MSVCAHKGVFSYCHPYHIAHGIRCFSHHIRRGVGVGAEHEARTVMPQGAGQGLHIHAVLQRQGCEGMLEIVEADVFRTDVLEDLLMGVPEGVRIEYPARLG